MNLAYHDRAAIPTEFVFRLAGPTWFDPAEWDLLKKVNRLKTDAEFIRMMTGTEEGDWKAISPAGIVDGDNRPTLIGYRSIDHCVPIG